MKIITFVFSIFFLLQVKAMADIPLLQGAYEYSADEISVLSAREEIQLQVRNESSQQYLRNLQNDGATCEFKVQSVYRCVRTLVDRTLPELLKEKINERYAGERILFEKIYGEPELVSEAPHLTEWQVRQDVKIGDNHFSRLTYQVLHNGDVSEIIKIKFEHEKSPRYFYLLGQGLGQMDHLQLQVQNLEPFVLSHLRKYTVEVFFYSPHVRSR